MAPPTAASVKEVTPKTIVLNMCEAFFDTVVAAQIVIMHQTVLIWLCSQEGLTKPEMGSLSLAMQTKFEKMPVGVPLLCNLDADSQGVASRLAKRTGFACYVMSSITDEKVEESLPAVEKRLAELVIKAAAGVSF